MDYKSKELNWKLQGKIEVKYQIGNYEGKMELKNLTEESNWSGRL